MAKKTKVKPAKKKYAWHGGRVTTSKKDPQIVGEEIQRIADSSGGLASKKAIVNESRPESAVLHDEFEWDDEVAAEKFRESQAGELVRSIVEVIVDPVTQNQRQTRAFVSVAIAPTNEENCRAYEAIDAVMADDDKRRLHINSCLMRLVRARDEYRNLNEFTMVWDAIDSVIQQIGAEV